MKREARAHGGGSRFTYGTHGPTDEVISYTLANTLFVANT